MGPESFPGGDAGAIIRIKAAALCRTAPYLRPDREDIEQELLISACAAWPGYDPSKSSHRTYLANVIQNKLVSIVRKETASVRDRRRHRPLGTHEAADPSDGRGAGDLRRDLATILTQLPEDMRHVCLAVLAEPSIAAAARRLGLPRGTFRERLKGVQRWLRDRGIEL